ncbi:MAG: sulfatase-like hydrolase/transferase [Lachnospiraceae bacterium]|nr:sulfatase-like hydrolase/transferase [Lachnospiraceae bacterium]
MSIKHKKIISILGLFVFPILHFYLLETYTHNGFTEVRPWSQFFNILLYEFVAVILFLLIRNVRLALWAEGMFAMVIGLINYYVYTFRSLPLVPWDILSVETALSVADNYNFMPTMRVFAVILGFVLVLFAEGCLEFTLKEWKWYQSLLPALGLCLVLGSFSHVLQQEGFQNSHRMYNKLFTPVRVWQLNGFALTMVMELPYLSVEKPEGYKEEEVETLLKEYAAESSENEVKEKPNIIVIMDEAFSDLSVLGDFKTNKAYMPYFHSLWKDGKNTISGYLHVSVCGGNTANTEFEFLTGNTMAFLPQGAVPYQQYVHREIPALPSYLKSLGYQTYAMHPYHAGGWDRDTVYPLLGFESMEFLPDYRYREYIRDYVSDRTCVKKIIDTYEAKDADSPAFIFNVTMQNHGSYGDIYENFTPDILVEGVNSYSLSTYLSLLKKTDLALEELITYFSEVDEPVIVVFFGDHQPNDTVAQPIWRLNGTSYDMLTEEQSNLRYQVPYMIWSNYEMDTKTGGDISVNYLAGKVLEAAGLPLSPYHAFLQELSVECPVISAKKIEKTSGGNIELLKNYQKLQYYQLFSDSIGLEE